MTNTHTHHSASVAKAVELIVNSRKTGKKLEGFPKEATLASADEAFLVQLEVAKALGQKISGFKVSGSTGSRLAGVILANEVLQSPANLPRKAGLRVETEIAVIIGAGAPTSAGSVLDREDARKLIAGIAAGIELIDSRFIAQGRLQPGIERHADQLSNGGYVIGPTLAAWDKIDLSSRPMKFWVGDRLLIDETLKHPQGDPFDSVAWLAGYLPAFGLSLEAGQFVTTGSYSGVHMVIPGDEVRAEFESVGAAAVKIGVTSHW